MTARPGRPEEGDLSSAHRAVVGARSGVTPQILLTGSHHGRLPICSGRIACGQAGRLIDANQFEVMRRGAPHRVQVHPPLRAVAGSETGAHGCRRKDSVYLVLVGVRSGGLAGASGGCGRLTDGPCWLGVGRQLNAASGASHAVGEQLQPTDDADKSGDQPAIPPGAAR